jgi:hypothetical protein
MKMRNVQRQMVMDVEKREKEKKLNRSDHEIKMDELNNQNKLKSLHIRDLLKERKEDKDTIKELREELKNLRMDVTILNEDMKVEISGKKRFHNEVIKLTEEVAKLKLLLNKK